MENHDLVSGEDKEQMLADMNEATIKAMKSENRFVKAFNGFCAHPVGVMLSLFGYCWMDGKMTRMSRDNEEESMESAFYAKMQEGLYKKMAAKMDVPLEEED